MMVSTFIILKVKAEGIKNVKAIISGPVDGK